MQKNKTRRKKLKMHKPKKKTQRKQMKTHFPISSSHRYSRGKPSALHPGNIPRHLDEYELDFVLSQGKSFIKKWKHDDLTATGFKTKIKKSVPELSRLRNREVIDVTYNIGSHQAGAIYSLQGDLLAVKGFNGEWHRAY